MSMARITPRCRESTSLVDNGGNQSNVGTHLVADGVYADSRFKPTIATVVLAHFRVEQMLALFLLLFRTLLLERHQLRSLMGNVLGAHLEFLDQLPGSA